MASLRGKAIMTLEYVHGYSARESIRLADQASILINLLHDGTHYPAGSSVLEPGCGVGAQTVILGHRSPQASITSIDVAEESLAVARERVVDAGLDNVTICAADVFDLPFPAGHFDHVFVCFMLEHLADPAGALAALRRVLAPGGTITVIEGDHGSAYFHPDGPNARRAVSCLVDLQRQAGGDSLIGRRLYPLLVGAGYRGVACWPRMVYVDASRPELVDGFTRRTFTAMVAGVGPQAIAEGLIDEATWNAGIAELNRTAEPDGTFCYTFFKAVATV
jgi:SAM-dependent methyltransferase